MNKLDLNDLKKLENYSQKQIKVLMNSKNDLDAFAYPFVTVKELKTLDKVLTKIKDNTPVDELNEEEIK